MSWNACGPPAGISSRRLHVWKAIVLPTLPGSIRMCVGWLKTDEHALAGGLASKLSEAEGRAIKLLTPPKPVERKPHETTDPARGGRQWSKIDSGTKDRLTSEEWSTTAEELAPEAGCESPLSAHDPLDDRGGAAMSVGALSPQQLRTIVEDKWQRDQEAIAVGLHVTTSWVGPSEVEFDFGKAQVVRADTVFHVREALRDAERDKARIILLTKLQQATWGTMSSPGWPAAACSPSITGPASAPSSRRRNSTGRSATRRLLKPSSSTPRRTDTRPCRQGFSMAARCGVRSAATSSTWVRASRIWCRCCSGRPRDLRRPAT